MITVLQSVDLLLALYAGGDAWKTFDFVEPGSGDHDVCWALKRTAGVSVVCLRGSATFKDWFRDFDAAIPWPHKGLGPVHPGFMLGMTEAYAEIQKHIAGPVVITGHSLGAARAAILAGLFILDGNKPLAKFVYGEPKPGFKQLASVCSEIPMSLSYRNATPNGHDLVTDVPLTFPPEEYVHSDVLTDVCAPPPANDEWGPLAWHHLQLYRQGLDSISNKAAA
jgi:Lipase (class 3)